MHAPYFYAIRKGNLKVYIIKSNAQNLKCYFLMHKHMSKVFNRVNTIFCSEKPKVFMQKMHYFANKNTRFT